MVLGYKNCTPYRMDKKPCDLADMLRRIEKVIKPFPKAAMFELRERGYTTIFEQLVSCIISIRTLDETTIPLTEKLLARARTPKEMLKLTPKEIEGLLVGSQYPGQKAYTILGIAQAAVEEYGGELPADFDKLTALKGVGPKCANLALGVTTGEAGISVDVHVHRVVNRWGMIQTKTPEKTMVALEDIVPKKKWIDINRLLMPFGKHICKMIPLCSTCPVLEYCRQVGVTKHR
jgi:endonuclease III